MFNRSVLYLLIVSTLMFSGCLIKGKIVDENGAGVAGVTVTLGGDASMTTTTDSDGDYQFGTLANMLNTGNYTVAPSKFGSSFTPASTYITIINQTLGDIGDVPWPAADADFAAISGCNSCTGMELDAIAGNMPFAGANTSASFYADLTYGNHPRQRIDLFIPEAGDTVGIIVYFHGGGFTEGDKSDAYSDESGQQNINYYLDQGVAYAAVNYPLLDDSGNGVIDSLEGAARSIQFLRCYANTLNIDPDRIAVYGGSAGAGISLWLATHDDLAQAESEDLIQQQSTRIQAATGYSAQATYDIVRWGEVLDTALQAFVDSGEIASSDISEWVNAEQLFYFYGISSFDELYTDEMETYRRDVDMLSMMDVNDAPLCVDNTSGPVDENDIPSFDYLHDALHALAIKNRAEEVGLESVVYANGHFVEYSDPSCEDCTAFLLRHLR